MKGDPFDVRKSFSEVGSADWASILRENPDVFVALAKSIVKKRKKNGSRQVVSARSLDGLNLPEYSEEKFHTSFNRLWSNHTIKEMVEITGLTINILQRLKSGERNPSYREMAQIADGFGLDRAFFLEYRIGYVLASVNHFLEDHPETATAWYAKVEKPSKLSI